MPYKQITAAYRDYAKFLREKVAVAEELVEAVPATVPAIQPSAAPKYASVPDLNEIIASPAGRNARHRGALHGGWRWPRRTRWRQCGRG